MAYGYQNFPQMPQQNNQMMPQVQQNPWASTGAAASYGYSQAAPQNSYSAPPTSQMSVDWIQGGINSAKAYPKPAPGCGIILMDSDEDKFYIKKTDVSGFPLPLRAFTYKEEVQQSESQQMSRQSAMPDMSQYVTKDDFEHMLEKYLGPVKDSK